jgi:uncharacterized protein with FMN-binding domain
MQRIVLWLLSTLSVLVLLFGYHTSTSSALPTSSPPAVFSGSTTGRTSSGETSSGGTQSGGTSSGGRSSGSGSSSGGSGTSTVTGSVASTQWGPVQVQLTVDNGAITAVNVMQYPSGNSRDAEINSQALPILIQETLDAQDANIDMVSGATVTSVGYEQSLQSALDEAGL